MLPPAIFVMASLLFAGCIGPLAGGGSEATNGNVVAGNLKYADGTSASHARIWLRPVGYLKDTSETGEPGTDPDAIADQNGHFVLSSLSTDDYLLEAQDGKGKGVTRYLSSRGGTTQLSPDTLRALGALQGRLERLGNVPQSAFARIFGLERIARADSAGNFAFTDLPAGKYRIEAASSLPDHGFQTSAPALIYPDSATQLATLPLIRSADEDYADWPFSRPLFLSTYSIPQGEIVRDFPLLVRLNADNFDFSQSLGSDIRFSSIDGRHLAYEVEHWDAQAREAEIWVLLDSISGGNPVQMTMHWGRLQAPDFSFGPAVFASFGGVWHMQENPGYAAEMVALDASPGAARLTGQVEAFDRTGAIGNSAGFRGSHFLKATSHAGLRPDSHFMISAWVKVAAIQPAGSGILSLGDNYVLRVEPTGTVRFFYYNDTITLSEPLAGPWVDAGTLIGIHDKSWHWLVANLEGDSLRICIDGISRASVRARGPVTYGRGTDLFIGLHGGPDSEFPFYGQIDEVRISSVSRSLAWIQFAHETQKPGSSTLIFR
jgi:Concanavalin A-like lectin/glucanases superfamily/Domain of unknown function (DUF2341)